MNSGRLLVNSNEFYCGSSSNLPCQLALKSDIPENISYVHPAEKQCNYVYTHPSTKQCNYTYTHPTTKQCTWEPDIPERLGAVVIVERVNQAASLTTNGSSTGTIEIAPASTISGLMNDNVGMISTYFRCEVNSVNDSDLEFYLSLGSDNTGKDGSGLGHGNILSQSRIGYVMEYLNTGFLYKYYREDYSSSSDSGSYYNRNGTLLASVSNPLRIAFVRSDNYSYNSSYTVNFTYTARLIAYY